MNIKLFTSRLTLGLLLANYSLLLLLPIPLSAQTITDEPPPPPPTDEPTPPPPHLSDPTEDPMPEEEEEEEEEINPVGPGDGSNVNPDINPDIDPETQNPIDSNEPEDISIEILPEEVTGEPVPETPAEITEEIIPESLPESVPEPETLVETPREVPNETFPEPPVEFSFVEGAESSVNDAAGETIADLTAGTFGDGTGLSIPASVQQTLLSLLTGDPTTKSLFGDPLLNPLIRALGQGGAGNLLSWQLAKSLLGLLRGDKVDAKKLLAAVAAYNALIKASSDDFLLNPPAELVAIRAVLAELVSAAEAEFRTPDLQN